MRTLNGVRYRDYFVNSGILKTCINKCYNSSQKNKTVFRGCYNGLIKRKQKQKSLREEIKP